METSLSTYDRFLNPIAECFTPDVAQRIVDVEADAQTIQRLEQLRAKANAGMLTDAERAEYEEFVEGMDLLSILKAKARAVLAKR